MSTALTSRPKGSTNSAVTRQTQVASGLTDPQKWLTYALLNKMSCDSVQTNTYNNFEEADREFTAAARRSGLSTEDQARMKAAMFEKQVSTSATVKDIGMGFLERAVFCAQHSNLNTMDNVSAQGWANHLNWTFKGPSATSSSIFNASPYSPYPSGLNKLVTAQDVQESWQSIQSFLDTAQQNDSGVPVSVYWDLKRSNRLQTLYAPGGTNGISLGDPQWTGKTYNWIRSVRPNPDDFKPGALERPMRAITDGTVPSFPYGVQPPRLAIGNQASGGTIPSRQLRIQAAQAVTQQEEESDDTSDEDEDEDEDDDEDDDAAEASGDQEEDDDTTSEEEEEAPPPRISTPPPPTSTSATKSSTGTKKGAGSRRRHKSSGFWFK